MRIAVEKPRGQADDVEKFAGPLPPPGRIAVALEGLHRARQDRAQRQSRIERRLRILENHLDLCPERPERRLVHRSDINPVIEQLARRSA